MRYVPAAIDDRPFDTMNTTPLIDVLLVLLIMFVITIPIQTHEVPIDLPGGRGVPSEPVVHRLAIDRAGALRLDGAAVSPAALPARLAPVAAADATLLLEIDPEARYEGAAHVLAAVKRAGVTRLGFVGNAGLRF